MKRAFQTGYVRGYMVVKAGVKGYSVKHAEAALVKSGHGRSVAGKQERSENEDKAYGAAREAWSQFLKANGVVTKSPQGGARPQTGKGKGDAVRMGFAAATGDIFSTIFGPIQSLFEGIALLVRRTLPSGPMSSAHACHETKSSGFAPMSSSFNRWVNERFSFAAVFCPSSINFGSAPAIE